MTDLIIKQRTLHPKQAEFISRKAKRKIIRAGRRFGKTIAAADMAVTEFGKGKRVLYVAPTTEQTEAFWSEVCRILYPLIEAKLLNKNIQMKSIEYEDRFKEKLGQNARIKAKTAWNVDMMRDDNADLLIMDEFQLQNEEVWDTVGAPMLLDKDGDAVFIYTPPSLSSEGANKSKDPRHAAKMFKTAEKEMALAEKEHRESYWFAYHATSWDNPTISHEALTNIARDMSPEAIRQELLAMDDDIQSSWLVYPQWRDDIRKIDRFKIPETWPVFSGHDFGKANPAALFIAQNTGTAFPIESRAIPTGDYVVFREYAPGSKTIPQHVAAFKDITTGYKIAKSVGGNLTSEDEVRQGYTAHGWMILPPKSGHVGWQVDRTRNLFGQNRIWIFNDLIGTLSQLASMLFVLDDTNHPTNKIKDEPKFHFMACLRYACSDFTVETFVDTMLKPLSTLHFRGRK